MHGTIESIRKKRRDDEGFTLIELLVVVVIIGVLVAIAVPVYLNYRKGAADKSAQSDVRGAISAVEQFYTENGNTYPATIAGTNTGTAGATITLSNGGTTTPQTVTLSDKTSLGYNRASDGLSYTICGHNTSGTDTKWYAYKSLEGGSVKESTITTAKSQTAC